MAVAPQLATVPPSFVMATVETWSLGFDTTNYLGPDESPSAPVSTLTDLNPDIGVISLSDDPVVIGNIITQILRGSELQAMHTYTLAVTFTVTDVVQPLMVLTINVPQ